jgi:hypothetical protein
MRARRGVATHYIRAIDFVKKRFASPYSGQVSTAILKNERSIAGDTAIRRELLPEAYSFENVNLTNPSCIVRYVGLEPQKFEHKSLEEQTAENP